MEEHMEEQEFSRETQPAGSLGPPERKPPTAIGVSDYGDSSGRHPEGSVVRQYARPNWLLKFFSQALDVIDELGDGVAKALHIR
jgi:hypothetical protein